MFQYAAAAGKVPVTLRHDSISDGFLLDQESLQIEFETPEQVCREIARLVTEPDYRREKEERLSDAVLNPDTFAHQLQLLMDTGNTELSLDCRLPDTRQLQRLYASNYTVRQLRQDLVRKGNSFLLAHFPVDYTLGFLGKLRQKLKKSM